jgi:hypothetical protein
VCQLGEPALAFPWSDEGACYTALVLRARSAFVVVTVATSVPAAADRASYHATGSGDVGVTDNVFQERRGAQDADLFFQLRPGVLLSYGLPRIIQDLAVEAEVTQYARHSEEASIAGRGTYNVVFTTGPRSQVSVSLNAGTGVLSAISARTPPDQSVVELRPLGNLRYRDASASQFATYVATRELRLSQRLFARVSETEDNASEVDPLTMNTEVQSAEAGGALAASRVWKRSSVSLEAGASVLRLERIAPPTSPQPSRLDRQVNPRGRVVYQRIFDEKFSGSIDAGLVYVIPYGTDPYNPTNTDRQRGLFPVAGAQFTYSDAWGVGTAGLRRDVSPNLLLGQNTVNEGALFAVAMPLPWYEDNPRRAPKLVGLGSFALMRTRLVDPVTSELRSSFGIGRVDLGVQFNARSWISYTVRYELIIQSGDRDALMPVNGFVRNTLFFSFRFRYPEDVAATVPKRRDQMIGSDGEDPLRGGGEPVIIDALDGLGR